MHVYASLKKYFILNCIHYIYQNLYAVIGKKVIPPTLMIFSITLIDLSWFPSILNKKAFLCKNGSKASLWTFPLLVLPLEQGKRERKTHRPSLKRFWLNRSRLSLGISKNVYFSLRTIDQKGEIDSLSLFYSFLISFFSIASFFFF